MKNKYNRLINIEEFVEINGLPQYLYHRGTKLENPVLLFLHGGPGSAESLFAHCFQEKWEEIYTVVHWDQRGAGKTLTKNDNAIPTSEMIINDLFEVVQYLKKKYNKEKIILLGHSWGSVLGSIFIKKYPNEIAYYIGVGQVVNMLENERVGYEKVKEMIIKANDIKSLKILQSLGDYPGDKIDFSKLKQITTLRKLQGKYDLAVKINFKLISTILTSPIYKFSDITALTKGSIKNKPLMDFLSSFNLYNESFEYKIPIYYILGDKDWQTPYILAQEYFNKIQASYKDLLIIPNACHMTMHDQPELFYEALTKIYIHEKDFNINNN